jgi:hypothetical protein
MPSFFRGSPRDRGVVLLLSGDLILSLAARDFGAVGDHRIVHAHIILTACYVLFEHSGRSERASIRLGSRDRTAFMRVRGSSSTLHQWIDLPFG